MTPFGDFTEQVKERMIRYAKVDTQSAEDSGVRPTTPGQFDLARMLAAELSEIGVPEVFFDEKACVVYAKLPANKKSGGAAAESAGGAAADAAPALGLIAHMDTSPEVSGKDVKPWVLENFGGGDIVLNASAPAPPVLMAVSDYQRLAEHVGEDLILTDGTTLLGGDDKAAIAELVTAAEYFVKHPETEHRALSLAFTPDEEVGGLAQDLDFARFGAEKAYTVDGDHLGWYGDQTFNASAARLTVRGRSVHPGTAKGIMINASDVAGEFLAMLPPKEKPQYTEGLEGFYYVTSVRSDCESAEVDLIIRDFDADAFAAREEFLRGCAKRLAEQYGADRIELAITPQYRNMYEILKDEPELIEELIRAIRACGVEPKRDIFRGGTDGAALSFRGLPCPNLSAGYENAHSRFEYVSVQAMEKTVEIIIRLCGGEERR